MTFLLEIFFLVFVIGSDLVTKECIAGGLLGYEQGNTYVVLENVFEFQYVENTGASFGAFAGNQAALIGLTSVIMLGIVALLIWQKDSPKFLRYSLLLILGGGIGNLVDRIAFNYVRDFIDYRFLDIILDNLFGTQFAIGNVADIYLCIGVLMVIIYVFFAFKESDFSMKWKKRQVSNE